MTAYLPLIILVWSVTGVIVALMDAEKGPLFAHLLLDCDLTRAQCVAVVIVLGPLAWLAGLLWLIWKWLGKLP